MTSQRDASTHLNNSRIEMAYILWIYCEYLYCEYNVKQDLERPSLVYKRDFPWAGFEPQGRHTSTACQSPRKWAFPKWASSNNDPTSPSSKTNLAGVCCPFPSRLRWFWPTSAVRGMNRVGNRVWNLDWDRGRVSSNSERDPHPLIAISAWTHTVEPRFHNNAFKGAPPLKSKIFKSQNYSGFCNVKIPLFNSPCFNSDSPF